MAYYDIGEVFQKIEEDMIASMMRNLKRHLATENEEGINYAMWQAEQLAALNEFKRNNSSLFGGYFSTINDQIEEVLKKAHASGKMEQEVQILEAIMEGWSTALKPSSTLQGAFFRINDRKLKALIKSVKSDMKKAETAMLRRANDEYRKIVFNSQAYYNTGAGTLPQCVDMATKDFLSKGIDCIEYKNGARVGIDAYSRMAIRTAQTRAYLLGESEKRDEWGINTVIVNKRGVACPRCLQYVGRVFYDDVWGTTPVPSPAKYPRLSEAIAGGLYHPNCKDIHTTYFEGVTTPPKPMTVAEKREATRVYNLEQQQRYNERQIRKYKRLSDGSVDPENQLRYQKKLEVWQDEQRRFVKANGDVLKRRYENEKLLVTEFSKPPKMEKNTKVKVTTADVNTQGTKMLSEAYERHRIKNGLTSVPYSELGDSADNIISANYGKMPVESATVFNNTISDLATEYDTPIQRIRPMTRDEFLGNSSNFAFVTHDYTVDSAELVINPAKFNDIEELKRRINDLSQRGYCVKIPASVAEKYIATHEFAHTLINLEQPLSNKTNWLGADYKKLRTARKEILDVYERYMADVADLTAKSKEAGLKAILEASEETWQAAREATEALGRVKLSNYSLESADEFMAEAFTNEKIGVSSNPYSKEVLDILNRYFKR